MNAFDYILSKQLQWAHRNNITIVRSSGSTGRQVYTQKLDDNLFEPLLPDVRSDFIQGDGRELAGNPCKMQAVHSSSVLSVNIFQYWKRIDQIPAIAAACGFCNRSNNASQDINFEVKFPITSEFQYSPNIDVVIRNSPKFRYRVFAIECKFSEAYSSRKASGIDPRYIELKNLWADIPNLYKFARTISPVDRKFDHLSPAQLLKHILGLKEKFGRNKFRLLYLWYDTIGLESAKHRREIKEFVEITKADGIYFHAMSYQELIIKLSNNYRDIHRDYIDYITERYL